jgi:hypothetical protein
MSQLNAAIPESSPQSFVSMINPAGISSSIHAGDCIQHNASALARMHSFHSMHVQSMDAIPINSKQHAVPQMAHQGGLNEAHFATWHATQRMFETPKNQACISTGYYDSVNGNKRYKAGESNFSGMSSAGMRAEGGKSASFSDELTLGSADEISQFNDEVDQIMGQLPFGVFGRAVENQKMGMQGKECANEMTMQNNKAHSQDIIRANNETNIQRMGNLHTNNSNPQDLLQRGVVTDKGFVYTGTGFDQAFTPKEPVQTGLNNTSEATNDLYVNTPNAHNGMAVHQAYIRSALENMDNRARFIRQPHTYMQTHSYSTSAASSFDGLECLDSANTSSQWSDGHEEQGRYFAANQQKRHLMGQQYKHDLLQQRQHAQEQALQQQMHAGQNVPAPMMAYGDFFNGNTHHDHDHHQNGNHEHNYSRPHAQTTGFTSENERMLDQQIGLARRRLNQLLALSNQRVHTHHNEHAPYQTEHMQQPHPHPQHAEHRAHHLHQQAMVYPSSTPQYAHREKEWVTNFSNGRLSVYPGDVGV